MVNYWIALSIWFKWALENQDNQSWWYLPGRDTPKHGDKVIIYQPGTTRPAKEHGVEIKDKHKYKFIGNFTVEDVDADSNNVWTQEKKIIWNESDFVDIYSIRDDLGCTSEVIREHGNMGLLFLNKTWIPISQRDYNLILSKKGK